MSTAEPAKTIDAGRLTTMMRRRSARSWRSSAWITATTKKAKAISGKKLSMTRDRVRNHGAARSTCVVTLRTRPISINTQLAPETIQEAAPPKKALAISFASDDTIGIETCLPT